MWKLDESVLLSSVVLPLGQRTNLELNLLVCILLSVLKTRKHHFGYSAVKLTGLCLSVSISPNTEGRCCPLIFQLGVHVRIALSNYAEQGRQCLTARLNI